MVRYRGYNCIFNVLRERVIIILSIKKFNEYGEVDCRYLFSRAKNKP